MPLPIGRPERHDRGHAHLLQPAGQDRVVVGVGQHHEAVVDQLLGGVEQLDRVGQQGALVGHHLELHPVGLERLAPQLGGAHRVAGGEAAGGVGQRADAGAVRAASNSEPGAPTGRPGAGPPWSSRCPRRRAPARARRGWARRRCRGSGASGTTRRRSPAGRRPRRSASAGALGSTTAGHGLGHLILPGRSTGSRPARRRPARARPGAAGDDLAVDGHGHAPGLDAQRRRARRPSRRRDGRRPRR